MAVYWFEAADGEISVRLSAGVLGNVSIMTVGEAAPPKFAALLLRDGTKALV